jgi:hypothetical protein
LLADQLKGDAMEDVLDATTMRSTEGPRLMLNRTRPSWTAMAAMLLSVTIPLCGWLVTLSNRVSALEVRTESLATAAQMAEVRQKIDDWIAESDRARMDDRVNAARESKQ